MAMKALCLTQPWGSLVALGQKRIETRSWPTSYRGTLAITSSKTMPRDCRELCSVCFNDPFAKHLDGVAQPLGAVVALVDVLDCHEIGNSMGPSLRAGTWGNFPKDEASFGDYTSGRFAWVLGNLRPLAVPVPLSSMQGIFSLDMKTEALVSEQGSAHLHFAAIDERNATLDADPRMAEVLARYKAAGVNFPETFARMEIATGRPVEFVTFQRQADGTVLERQTGKPDVVHVPGAEPVKKRGKKALPSVSGMTSGSPAAGAQELAEQSAGEQPAPSPQREMFS